MSPETLEKFRALSPFRRKVVRVVTVVFFPVFVVGVVAAELWQGCRNAAREAMGFAVELKDFWEATRERR